MGGELKKKTKKIVSWEWTEKKGRMATKKSLDDRTIKLGVALLGIEIMECSEASTRMSSNPKSSKVCLKGGN